MEARRWLDGVSSRRPAADQRQQAAPVDPPPAALRQAMADVALRPTMRHLYGPVLGLPDLRAELARKLQQHYGGTSAATGLHHLRLQSGLCRRDCIALR